MVESEQRKNLATALIGRVISFLTVVLVLLCVVLFGVQGVDYIPDDAIVYVDSTNTYYSPPLTWEDDRVFHVLMHLDDVKDREYIHVSREPQSDSDWEEISEEFNAVWVCTSDKTWTEFQPVDGILVHPVTKGSIKGKDQYSPDREHVSANGFFGESRALFFHLLGLNNSRWTDDCEWKW